MRKFSPYRLYAQAALVLGITIAVEAVITPELAMLTAALSIYYLHKANEENPNNLLKLVGALLLASVFFLSSGGLYALASLQTTNPILLALASVAGYLNKLISTNPFARICAVSFGLLGATAAVVGLSDLIIRGVCKTKDWVSEKLWGGRVEEQKSVHFEYTETTARVVRRGLRTGGARNRAKNDQEGVALLPTRPSQTCSVGAGGYQPTQFGAATAQAATVASEPVRTPSPFLDN